MSRYSAGGLTTAGSTTLPVIALTGGTGVRIKIREIGVFNTTSTAVALKLARFTGAGAGTAGSTLTSAPFAQEEPASVALCKNTYSVAPTVAVDLGYRCVLGAAVGSGMVWTFPDPGLVVPAVASTLIGVLVENGTGQALQAYFVWEE